MALIKKSLDPSQISDLNCLTYDCASEWLSVNAYFHLATNANGSDNVSYLSIECQPGWSKIPTSLFNRANWHNWALGRVCSTTARCEWASQSFFQGGYPDDSPQAALQVRKRENQTKSDSKLISNHRRFHRFFFFFKLDRVYNRKEAWWKKNKA